MHWVFTRLLTNSSHVFSNLFHEFFLSLCSWKRKQTSYWFQTIFFLNLPVEKEILQIFVKKSRLVKPPDEFVIILQFSLMILKMAIKTNRFYICLRSNCHCLELFFYFFEDINLNRQLSFILMNFSSLACNKNDRNEASTIYLLELLGNVP